MYYPVHRLVNIKDPLLLNSKRKEENVLFNDSTRHISIQLYGVGHNIVKDHSESERGNPLPATTWAIFD